MTILLAMMIKMTVIMIMAPQSVIFQIHQRLEGANAASLSRPPWNPSPWTKGIYLFLLLNVWEKGYNQCQILYETNVYRETYVKCTWTEIGCKWNVFASSLFLSMITMIFSVLIAMIWWWCWLRSLDDDVGGSDELWTKAATRATSLNISLSFPTNPSHNLHLHGWWWLWSSR